MDAGSMCVMKIHKSTTSCIPKEETWIFCYAVEKFCVFFFLFIQNVHTWRWKTFPFSEKKKKKKNVYLFMSSFGDWSFSVAIQFNFVGKIGEIKNYSFRSSWGKRRWNKELKRQTKKFVSKKKSSDFPYIVH